MAGVGKSTRADAWEWYVECQGEPVPISFAASFVQAVRALADPAVAAEEKAIDDLMDAAWAGLDESP